jgi:hypothetical protein
MWCRCFKCDGKVNATGCTCEKDKMLTCRKWYDGYRTALLALSEYEQQMMAKAIDGTIRPDDGEVWCDLKSFNFKDGDKVKVIVIKED